MCLSYCTIFFYTSVLVKEDGIETFKIKFKNISIARVHRVITQIFGTSAKVRGQLGWSIPRGRWIQRGSVVLKRQCFTTGKLCVSVSTCSRAVIQKDIKSYFSSENYMQPDPLKFGVESSSDIVYR